MSKNYIPFSKTTKRKRSSSLSQKKSSSISHKSSPETNDFYLFYDEKIPNSEICLVEKIVETPSFIAETRRRSFSYVKKYKPTHVLVVNDVMHFSENFPKTWEQIITDASKLCNLINYRKKIYLNESYASRYFFDEDEQDEETMKKIVVLFSSNNNEKRVIGFAELYMEKYSNYVKIEYLCTYKRPAQTQQMQKSETKLGKIMIDYITSLARKYRKRKILLSSVPTAIKFYEKFGFQIINDKMDKVPEMEKIIS